MTKTFQDCMRIISLPGHSQRNVTATVGCTKTGIPDRVRKASNVGVLLRLIDMHLRMVILDEDFYTHHPRRLLTMAWGRPPQNIS